MITKHPEEKIKCDEEGCDKEFHLKFDFDKHMDSHRKRICPICGKELANKKQLVRHLECHSETTFVCTICGKSYNTRYTLSRHMGTHLDVGKYKCNYCGKHFKNGKCMKLHLLAHSGLRPYKCGFCEKTFPDNTRCTDHMKRHPEWKEKKDLGQKITSVLLMEVPTLHELQEQALKNNVPVKPVASYAERKPQYLPCSVCNMIFPSNYKLKLHLNEAHLRSGTNNRPGDTRLNQQQPQQVQPQLVQPQQQLTTSSPSTSNVLLVTMPVAATSTTNSVVVLNQPQNLSQLQHQQHQQQQHHNNSNSKLFITRWDF
uniref:C2H2-type domain-containing protein n=1 Tax=Megaselia scalaris TaxID=36166 RepID=T1GLB9_MEGSC